MRIIAYIYWAILFTYLLPQLRAWYFEPWVATLFVSFLYCLLLLVAPLAWIWRSDAKNRKVRLSVLLALQFIPILATEAYFRPDELRFIRSVELGKVGQDAFGFHASQRRPAPFESFSLQWDSDMGFWILE